MTRWFTTRGLPPWYTAVVLVGAMIASMGLTLYVSFTVNERSLKREEQSRRNSELDLCQFIIVQDDIYRTTPPTTAAGKRIAVALGDLRVAYRCPG